MVKRKGSKEHQAYNAFLCALAGEDPDNFFFSEDNGLEQEASDSDGEADNGYYCEDTTE